MPEIASPWLALSKAAKYLDLNTEALKKRCQRNSTPTKAGGVQAVLAPGVVARKFGRLWLVRFTDGWGVPDNDQ